MYSYPIPINDKDNEDTEEEDSEESEAEIEVEGGGSSWWYVCGDCHGAVDEKDNYCRHCGKRLKR